MRTDTIAAVATGLTNSGIGIVRISGPDSFAVIKSIFRGKNGGGIRLERSHTVQYGFIYDGDRKLDEVLVIVMKGPHSYTGEDTVEIDCHGGVLMMRRILETVLRNGARSADPGEFTKRAFLNGRIDLSQAEAVIDVINAKNDRALKSSVAQLGGSLSRKIREIRSDILYEIAYIESVLDDPEHISLDGYRDELEKKVKDMICRVRTLLDSADEGRIISDGIRTVITGRPNAGKSSVMNVIAGEDRAIVTEIAGTTRDTLEEQVRFGDISLNIVDTAGIRDTEDAVEKIGVGRAKDAILSADLILYVVDASEPLDENDREIMEMIRGRKAVVLLNKSDLPPVTGARQLEAMEELSGHKVISVSAKERTGFDALKDTIREMFFAGGLDLDDEVLITDLRHKEALAAAHSSLLMVLESIQSGMPEDFFSIDLTDAYERLGSIIGEAVEDDVVNEIFSQFCVGK